ncbi:hypothetical protein SAMN05216299_10579 [Nitrosospira sp. Nsp14]|nr:hypothetical protein SAMN05216299_10579 [Nitrosospira sp. Nsp14]
MVMMTTVVVMPIVMMMPASIVATMMPTVTPMPIGPQRTSGDQSDHGKDEARRFDHADSCVYGFCRGWLMLPRCMILA